MQGCARCGLTDGQPKHQELDFVDGQWVQTVWHPTCHDGCGVCAQMRANINLEGADGGVLER